MNERIIKLSEHANDYANHLDKIGVDDGWQNIFNQKFAQLIVQEYEDEIWNCVLVESAGSDDKFLIRGIVRSALHDAKQHFGVEE